MPLTVRPDPDVEERYSQLAKNTGRSKSYYINKVLNENIDQLEYEFNLLNKVEKWRAGKLKTVTLDELEESLGLAD